MGFFSGSRQEPTGFPLNFLELFSRLPGRVYLLPVWTSRPFPGIVRAGTLA